MSLNYVTLTVDVYDAQGNVPTSGYATFTPSATLTDTTNHEIVAQIPIVVSFKPSGPPAVRLLATDNGTVNPGGWGWQVSFTGTGLPSAFSFFLLFASGASQNLSSLSPVGSVVTMAAYMPLAGGTFTGDVNAAAVALTDGASISLDASKGNVFTVTLGGNRTLANPTNPSDEQLIRLVVTQDGSGNRTLAYGSAYNFGSNSPPTLSTTAAARDTLGFAYNAGAAKWDFLASTTGGGLALDTTAADIQPLGVQTAGAIGKGADSGHIHPYQPWQFLPETYGAKGDGKVVGDAAITSGQAILTSATAAFVAGDAGKTIMVNGAQGSTALPLITTIASRQSATQVTLSATASATVTGGSAFWATDDTAAINSAVTAAKTYALANGYFAQVVFGPKFYGLAAAPTQSGNGSSTPTFNSQIPLPYPAVAGTSQKLVIELVGAGDAGQLQFWESTTPNLQGTCLVSMVAAASTQPDVTFGWQSVIGGPTGAAGFTGSFANVKPVVRGITVVCPALTRQYAYDFRYCASAAVDKASAQAFASVAGNAPKLPDLPALGFFQSRASVGLAMPVTGNNDDCVISSFAAEGFETCVRADDHLTGGRVAVLYFDFGLLLTATDGISGNNNRVTIANYSAEQGNTALACNGGFMPVDICMTAEGIGTNDVSDSGNALHGVIRWSNTAGGVPAVNSAANVKIVNDNLGPGPWGSPPSVPATTVAATNSSWRDATVFLTSGGAAVTVIKVNGTTTGLTLGTTGSVTLRVPSGQTITLTYASTAPTWVWVLD